MNIFKLKEPIDVAINRYMRQYDNFFNLIGDAQEEISEFNRKINEQELVIENAQKQIEDLKKDIQEKLNKIKSMQLDALVAKARAEFLEEIKDDLPNETDISK